MLFIYALNRNDSTIIVIIETTNNNLTYLSDFGFFYNYLYNMIYNIIKCVELAMHMTLVIYTIENYNQIPNNTVKLEYRKRIDR